MIPEDLQTELRTSLKRRAALTPPPEHLVIDTDLLADAAIHRARAVRRRRAGAGLLAVVLVLAGAVTAIRSASFGADPAPGVAAPEREPFPAVGQSVPAGQATVPAPLVSTGRPYAPDAALPVDVVVANRLVTVAGQAADLSGVGHITEAYRLASGWLLVSEASTGESVWFFDGVAAARPLLTDVAGVRVAADGSRVAWTDRTRAYVASLDGQGGLVVAGETRVPDGAVPTAFIGAGVLLARRPAEQLWGAYAVWWPGRPLTGQWRVASGVYGGLADGRTVVAQLPGPRDRPACLALLDAHAGLKVLKQECDLAMTPGAVGWLSPDGRWLVAESTPDESLLVDIADLFGHDEHTVGTGPRPTGPGVWTDTRTVVYGGDGHLARLRLDLLAAGQPHAVERIEVDGGSDATVLAVPTLDA